MALLRSVCALLALLAVAAPAATAATRGPALAVDAGKDRRAISPDLYGMNFADRRLAAEIGLPVDRWGGNRTDRYNWRAGADNTGNDYFFETLPDCWSEEQAWCSRPGARDFRAYRAFVEKDRAVGARSLITLPMLGMVARPPVRYGHPFPCSFPRSRFPSQQQCDPFDTACGNGRRPDGTEIVNDDPARTGLAVEPEFSAEWVRDLVRRYGIAARGGVAFYELGNEPNLWNSTHRDVHPRPTTFDELFAKSRDLAAAVKAVDPSARTLGPAEWGWPNYFCSALDDISDGCQPTDRDRAAHGGAELVSWFLARMRDEERRRGVRLLDYLDLHYYAQGGTGTAVTRSLWDRRYRDPSWIAEAIELIPRMRRWVREHYPGTRIALSEYDLGRGPDPRTETLVQADVLGIFAREGVDLATRWGPPGPRDLEADAWRIFRNYDGRRGRFGDTWVRSRSADQGRLAVYGAQRGAGGGALTVLVINKSSSSLTSRISLAGFRAATRAQVWRWKGAGIRRAGTAAVRTSGFSATFPAKSMTLFVVPRR